MSVFPRRSRLPIARRPAVARQSARCLFWQVRENDDERRCAPRALEIDTYQLILARRVYFAGTLTMPMPNPVCPGSSMISRALASPRTIFQKS